MRTLKGYEALEVADEYQISLYDVYYKNELSVDEAQQFIESKRDPQSFVLENWPDTEEEAERIVINKYRQLLKEHQVSHARIIDLEGLAGGFPLHPQAAELAADRLIQRHQLVIGETQRDGAFYGIPATTYLTDAFLDDLRELVCDECAHLNLEAPFHDTCLRTLLEFFATADFSFQDITEIRAHSQRNGKLTNMIRPGFGLLSKTVAETKSRWQSVFKPIFNKEAETEHTPSQKPYENASRVKEETIRQPSPAVVEEAVEPESPARVEVSATTSEATYEPKVQKPQTERPQVTKNEIIEYLSQIEIIDDNGTITKLEQERAQLAAQIRAKEQEMEKTKKDRAFWEKQFHEMERDMDTMIEALQIAKRRQNVPDRVVDATYADKSE